MSQFSSGEPRILSVHALTELIDRQLSGYFPFVWVRGEISDFHVAQSGHMYFSLRDSRALLNCVWFAGRMKQQSGEVEVDALTGEVFEKSRPAPELFMRNGLEILCAGSITVYRPAGRYQLSVELAEPVGDGARLLILEERKARLARAGYFAMERKRRIPLNPARVAVVTSLKGAAIHDFLRMAQARGFGSRIRIYPANVQGAGAAARMAEAIQLANAQEWAEVIVLIRGGGSAEDLAEFNEEALAEAIFQSLIPVVAGIGHEIDWCIADLTADQRAATPTHAAQLLWPLRQEMCQVLDSMQLSLERSMRRFLDRRIQRIEHCASAIGHVSPVHRLAAASTNLAHLESRLERALKLLLDAFEERLGLASRSLVALPLLARQVDRQSERLCWLAQSLQLSFTRILDRARERLASLARLLPEVVFRLLQTEDSKVKLLEEMLAQRNPSAPLQRGYALLFLGEKLLTSVNDCSPGQQIRARLADGELELRIEGRVK